GTDQNIEQTPLGHWRRHHDGFLAGRSNQEPAPTQDARAGATDCRSHGLTVAPQAAVRTTRRRYSPPWARTCDFGALGTRQTPIPALQEVCAGPCVTVCGSERYRRSPCYH